MHLLEPAELSGTVALENGTSPSPLMIGLFRRGELGGGTIPREDGAFVLKGLLPGHYWIEVMPDPRLPGVTINGSYPAGRISTRRDAILARPRKPILVSAYLGHPRGGFRFQRNRTWTVALDGPPNGGEIGRANSAVALFIRPFATKQFFGTCLQELWLLSCPACSLRYDKDGKLDLFVSNYVNFDIKKTPVKGTNQFCRWKGMPVMCGPRGLPGGTNLLCHNNGDGTFTDVSEKSGITKPSGYYALHRWSPTTIMTAGRIFTWACDSTPNILYHTSKSA